MPSEITGFDAFTEVLDRLIAAEKRIPEMTNEAHEQRTKAAEAQTNVQRLTQALAQAQTHNEKVEPLLESLYRAAEKVRSEIWADILAEINRNPESKKVGFEPHKSTALLELEAALKASETVVDPIPF